jgi:protein arginine kinase
VLNELNVKTQPGFLQKMFGDELSATERDMYRAKLLRETLGSQH